MYYNGTRLTTKNEEETETEDIQSDEEEPSGGEDEEQEQTYNTHTQASDTAGFGDVSCAEKCSSEGKYDRDTNQYSFQNAENKTEL